MSFKKGLAMVLAMAALATVGGEVPALAAEQADTNEVSAVCTLDAANTGCVVSGFAFNEEQDVVGAVGDGSMITLSAADVLVPMASSASKVAEDQKQAAENSQKEKEEIAAQKKAAKKKYRKALRLLSAIIYCEAGGQCYAGRLAVAAVVMNRVESGGYPNTIHGVLWQPYQFGPIRQGKMARELRYYDQGLYKQPERSGSLKAAKDILAGKYTVVYNGQKINLKKYHNFNGHLSNAKIRISGHDFA